MVAKGEKEIIVLKLEHEETKLFLQLIWSSLLSFLVSLIMIKDKIRSVKK